MSTNFEEDFCGGQFWNLSLTWDTDNPDFTPCFHKTVLAWIPTSILALFSFNEYRIIKASDNRTISFNILNLTKLLFTCLLIVLTIVEFVYAIIIDNDDSEFTNIFPVDYVTSTIYFISYCW